ncbi:MAG: hypothetical protein NT126_08680 [Bacteroidetes bacterium]|nr:hypothetical protein [Bacteroidota bacterium]
MYTPAPIALFVYNRPAHTRRLLISLRRNRLSDQSALFVFSDGPKPNATADDLSKIAAVKKIISEEKWCREVTLVEGHRNAGLADSIVSGTTEIINRFGKIIVLEDDLELAPGFLEYMNEALEIYREEKKVMHVSGYMYPVKQKLPSLFFVNTTSCWGWATWKRAWDHYDPSAPGLLSKIHASGRLKEYTFNNTTSFLEQLEMNASGKLNTWAIKWNASVFLQNGYCLHPYPSLARNTGNDGTGTHGSVVLFNEQKITDRIPVVKIPIEEFAEARKAIEHFYRKLNAPENLFRKIKNKLVRMFLHRP